MERLSISVLGILAGFLAAVVAFVGCATRPDGTPITSVERVNSIVKLSAYVSAKAALANDPAKRDAFTQARNGFCDLAASGNYDLQTAVAIASAQGLDILNSEEGALILIGAPLLFDAVFGRPIDLTGNEHAAAVLEGACEGLTLALGTPRAAPVPGVEDPVLENLRAAAKATR